MESKSVLIISSEPDFCVMLSEWLFKMGYRGYYTGRFKEGFEKVTSMRPDIIVFENHILNGEEAIRTRIDAYEDYDPDVFVIDKLSDPKRDWMHDMIQIIKALAEMKDQSTLPEQ